MKNSQSVHEDIRKRNNTGTALLRPRIWNLVNFLKNKINEILSDVLDEFESQDLPAVMLQHTIVPKNFFLITELKEQGIDQLQLVVSESER